MNEILKHKKTSTTIKKTKRKIDKENRNPNSQIEVKSSSDVIKATEKNLDKITAMAMEGITNKWQVVCNKRNLETKHAVKEKKLIKESCNSKGENLQSKTEEEEEVMEVVTQMLAVNNETERLQEDV